MQNVNIDNGFKTFTINNDPDKVISFDPSDINIISRANEMRKNVDERLASIKTDFELDENGEPLENDENFARIVGNINDLVISQIDYVFNAKIGETLFSGTSPLSSKGGILYYERVLNALMPVIEQEIKKETAATQKRMEKHTGKYKGKK